MHSETFKTRSSRTTCRCCGHTGLAPVLDLGQMPLTAVFLNESQLKQPEKKYPLEVAFCPQCSLVQVLETVPPQEIFHKDYPYYSSFSQMLLEHSRKNALALIEKRKLNASSLVVELASNDGYLLKNFVEKGVPVLGIDPAPGPADAARKIGVPTVCDFFGTALAKKLVAEGKRADVVIANNVMAHVADIKGFVGGIATILKEDGVLVSESPYLRQLIEHREFDTIYHEHLFYYSVTALDQLLRRNGLFLNDIEALSIHGGSLRIYAGRKEAVSDTVKRYLREEKQLGMDRAEYYRDFATAVHAIRTDLRNLLLREKSNGKRIVAYGAAAKGVILLNFIGIGASTIDYAADRNVHKQGKFMPGIHLPVCDPSRIVEEMPDYVLILPWNIKDEILNQQADYRRRGGKFIVPIPTPQIL